MADLARLMEYAEALRNAVHLQLPFDHSWTASHFARFMASDDAVVLISDSGFLAGAIQPTIISPQLVAMEHGWFCEEYGRGRLLLAAFETWARAKGASLIKLSTGADGPDLGKYGYALSEKAWVKKWQSLRQ